MEVVKEQENQDTPATEESPKQEPKKSIPYEKYKNPKQQVKEGLKDWVQQNVNQIKTLLLKQSYVIQEQAARQAQYTTIVDIIAKLLCEEELVETAMPKEEVENLTEKYVVVKGVVGNYAIDTTTLKFYSYVSCLEGYELIDVTELEPLETEQGKIPQGSFKFKKKDFEMEPIEIVASSQPEAYGKLRNLLLGL